MIGYYTWKTLKTPPQPLRSHKNFQESSRIQNQYTKIKRLSKHQQLTDWGRIQENNPLKIASAYTLCDTLLVVMWTSISTVEIRMEAPQKSKNKTTISIWSSDITHGHTSKGCKSGYNRDVCTLMFIAALFTITKGWEIIQMSHHWLVD
jgi:hypothetical protein